MTWKLQHAAVAMASLALCAVTAGAQVMRISAARGDAGNTIVLVSDSGVVAVDSEQAKDDLMEGLDKLGANAKERNEVNLDKSMMAIAGGRKGGKYADLSQKMDFITVRNYEFAQKGQYQKSDLDALKHKLEGNGWSHLVRNESDGETNDIVVKASTDGFISDMVILNAEPRELNIVHLRGHFKMEDVNGAMSSAMGFTAGGMVGGVATHVTVTHSSSTTPTAPAPPSPPSEPAPPRR